METMTGQQPQLQPQPSPPVPIPVAPPITSQVNLRDKFNHLKEAMKSTFAERDDVVDISVAALLSKQNAFFLGVPGTAKSAIVRYLSDSIVNARGFDILLGKFTTPEKVFGPLDLKALKEGYQKTIVDDHLANAHIGFLDEIWKASNAILNSLLTIINERKFHDGGKAIDCPLISTFSASNELPQSESELAALYDRFLLKAVVNPISNPAGLNKLLAGGKATPAPVINLSDLEASHGEIRNVSIPKAVLADVAKIVFKIRKEGIVVSDRAAIAACSDVNPLTGNKALSIIKVPAWLDGRTEVNSGDLVILKHVFWSDPKDAKIVSGIIYEVANPYEKKAQDSRDVLAGIMEALSEAIDSGSETYVAAAIKANEDVKKLARQIWNIIEKGSNTDPKLKPLREIYDLVTAASKEIARKALGEEVPVMKRPVPRLS